MSCFSEDETKIFEQFNESEICTTIEREHAELLTRRVDKFKYGDPASLIPKERVRLNCQMVAQVQLHRAERLLMAVGSMLRHRNVYVLGLIARGFVEGTAILGALCNRLESMTEGNITFETFELESANALMAAKHEAFTKAKEPVNILTSVERADKYLDKHFFKDKRKMLEDNYNWLSEYVHPNFLSNVHAFRFDKPAQSMVFRHDNELEKGDFEPVAYLSMCAPMFVFLFDRLVEQAETTFSA